MALQREEDGKVVVPRVRSSSFVEAVATGLSITGPTPDGHVHLHFHRDIDQVRGEVADLVELSDKVVKLGQLALPDSMVDSVRLGVATLSIHHSSLSSFIDALTRHRDATMPILEALKASNAPSR